MSLGLLGAYVSSDSSDSDSSAGEEESKPKAKSVLTNPFNDGESEARILPRPSFMVQQEDVKSQIKSVENSVFQNPFRVKEDKKKAVLERHVEMTVKQEEQRTIDGKKVCWNFRKGRCRFGSKCTFAHDSDVKVKSGSNQQNSSLPRTSGSLFSSTPEEPNPEVVIENNKKTKKRPGLSQGLIPSKKAMKFHDKVYNK